MGIRAYAIANDMGVMFRDHQLLIFPRRANAKRVLEKINYDEDGEFDGRIERVVIERVQK